MFGTLDEYGEMFQASTVHKRGDSLSVYKLVRVAGDGRLVAATDDDILEVNGLLENNENDMPILPDPRQTEGYIPDKDSPSQLLQLESLKAIETPGLFQSETAEANTEKLNSRLESEGELMYGSQMLFTLPDNKFQSSIESWGNEEHMQSEVLLQEPIRFSLRECSMNQSMDVSPYSNATVSPKESALSTAASKPQFSRVAGKLRLDKLSIKGLQETFRATFGRETTVKDKQWLKRRITMGLANSCVVPTTNLTINDNKLIGGGQDNYDDTIDAFREDMVDEKRTSNCKDTPSSLDSTKRHSNDFGHSPVVDHYSGNEDFEGDHRLTKRVRKPTRRYIEEFSKTDENQQSGQSMMPSKDERSIQSVSSGGRVVVTRMVSLAGSRIQVPYVSHVRRSRPRENIMAFGEFHSRSWEVKPGEFNLNLSPSQLNKDVNGVAGAKSASGPVQIESNKDHLKPIFTEVDQDVMEPEHVDTSGHSSDDDDDNRVDLPIKQSAIRRKHHRAWTLSEVIKLVEGVSKYGVGKWSEIKKLSFKSYSYRTSVDLKDKWRNLRKASFAQTPPNKMGSLRKYGSMAIPSQILLQVKELVQKQSLVSKARLRKQSRSSFM